VFPSEPGSFAARTERLQNVDAPLDPDETHKFAQVADRVRVDPISHYYNVITSFYGDLALSLHYDLRKQLASRAVTPAVYCCGYDWRQDNHTSAQRLAKIVDEAQADCDGARVVIVAHSMGGIVSREYCRTLGGESKVRGMFLLGSPTLGAVSAFENLRNGFPFDEPIRRLLNLSRDDTRDLMRSMQSAFQLLPNQVYCSAVRRNWASFDPRETGYNDQANTPLGERNPAFMITDNSNSFLFYRDIYTGLRDDPRTRQGVEKHLIRALEFHGGISVGATAYVHPKTFAYFCSDLNTSGSVNISYDGVVVRNGAFVVVSNLAVSPVAGDSTVPGDSANPTPVSAPIVERRGFGNVDHVSLSSNPLVIAAVRDRIVSLL
jgi:triacylglycerol esterase/lipase EstA (alpha/beta hydrolase family)